MITAVLSGTSLWNTSEPFDGYVILAIVFPAGTTEIRPNGFATPDISLPTRIRIPIKSGVFNQNVKIPFNSSYEPISTKYCAFWFDCQDKPLAAPASSADFFIIDATPYVITIPTLTGGVFGTVVPTLT